MVQSCPGKKERLSGSPTSHLKPMELLKTFRLKSVFCKAEWVARKLSSKEIGAAWDLPLDCIGKMETELIRFWAGFLLKP